MADGLVLVERLGGGSKAGVNPGKRTTVGFVRTVRRLVRGLSSQHFEIRGDGNE